jgi:hypothetical protein
MADSGAGLLAGQVRGPLSRPTFDPTELAQPVRGRRLGRVGGVLAEPTLQLGHPRLQRSDQTGVLSVDRSQGGIGRSQLNDDRSLDRDGRIGIKRSDRGLQDNQRSSPPAHGPGPHSYTSSRPPVNRPQPSWRRQRHGMDALPSEE